MSDLVDGLLRLARSDCTEPVNLGSEDEVTMRALAAEVIALTGGRSELRFDPLPSDDPKCRRPDITRARERLGWQPTVDRRTGLTATIADVRARLMQAPATAHAGLVSPAT